MGTIVAPAKNYVLGFAFSEDRTKVVLIRKKRPDWQAGKLNGVGGKIENSDANGYVAMCREFREEVGLETVPEDWLHYLTLNGEHGYVLVFCAFGDRYLRAVKNTDEDVEIVEIDYNRLKDELVSNLSWLLAIAVDENQPQFFVDVHYGQDFSKHRGM